MRLLVSALALAVFAAPSAFAACLEMPESVTLKVDSFRVETVTKKTVYIVVTASGIPPGQWRMRCAVRNKEGRYLGVGVTADFQVPASAPAADSFVLIDPKVANQIVGADCTAIPFVVLH